VKVRRALRLLLLAAPLLVLALGVPLGASLAGRMTAAPQDGAVAEPAGGLAVSVAATTTPAPPLGPRAPTRAPRLGPPVPTNAPVLGPRAPTNAPRLGPPVPTATPRPGAPTPFPTITAQNGLTGAITDRDGDRLVVFTKAGRVAMVVVESDAIIRLNGRTVRLAALAVGDEIVALGSRDSDGTFRAELIRAVRPE